MCKVSIIISILTNCKGTKKKANTARRWLTFQYKVSLFRNSDNQIRKMYRLFRWYAGMSLTP